MHSGELQVQFATLFLGASSVCSDCIQIQIQQSIIHNHDSLPHKVEKCLPRWEQQMVWDYCCR